MTDLACLVNLTLPLHRVCSRRPPISQSLNVIIHRGAVEIVGSCIEVASDRTRLVFDCGWPLEGEGTVAPPPVPGLFAPGHAPQAVFLTHAHPDHTGFIEQMPGDV